MKEIEKKVLSNAIRMLDSINLEYCIQLPDGQFVGALKVESKKSPRKYPYGSVTKYVSTFIDQMEQGKVITIPVHEFDLDSIQSIVCNILRDKFGSGNYTTHRNDDSVEMLLLTGEST